MNRMLWVIIGAACAINTILSSLLGKMDVAILNMFCVVIVIKELYAVHNHNRKAS